MLCFREPVRVTTQSESDIRLCRRSNEFSWKNRHASGLMHDRPVRWDPLFSAPARTTSGANDSSVNTPKVRINATIINDFSQQRLFDPVQRAIGIPSVEVFVNGHPRTEFFRKVSPRRPGSQPPKNPVNHIARIGRGTTCCCRFGENVRNQFPLRVRESMTCHPWPPWISNKDEHSHLLQNPTMPV